MIRLGLLHWLPIPFMIKLDALFAGDFGGAAVIVLPLGLRGTVLPV